MDRCMGDCAVTTKMSEDLRDFLEARADALDVSRSEVVRRALDAYRESYTTGIDCVQCGEPLKLKI